jgi:1-deoxy-D-xylulose-5-phosphate reductoisomerase
MSSTSSRTSSFSRPKRVIVLGSTGSIGTSTMKVARDIPERLQIVGLAAHKNVTLLAEQAREFGVRDVCVVDEVAAREAWDALPDRTTLLTGEKGLVELVRETEADMVIMAIVGTGGLRPALAAIETGKDLAIASKEILVMAGEAVMTAARARGVRVLPIDSEHNAIFQCLEGRDTADVSRLILTASGGPFRTATADQIAAATVEQALKHPTWDMGRKITIDSATLFNKGLEMIEARWLFDVEMSRVDVIVHPQSIIHSMVEFIDGSTLAQLSYTDMCFPIQYAATWPERVPNTLKPLDFAALSALTFESPRRVDFPALDLARHAGEIGGTLPAVMNAANEIAVDAFLAGRLSFPGIWQTVARVMEAHTVITRASLSEILDADNWARRIAAEALGAQ